MTVRWRSPYAEHMLRLSLIALALFAYPPDADARRAPQHGQLEINCLNVGAEVYVNGVVRGKTPFKRPLRMKPGRHTVRISLIGYADFIDTFTVKRGRRTQVNTTLIPTSGILEVDGFPRGAEVLIDGRVRGQLPFKDIVDPGRFDLTVRAVDYLPDRRSLVIEAGETNRLDVQLVFRPDQELTVQSPWYENYWIWIGTAGVIVTAAVTTAVLVGDPSTDSGPNIIRVETIR